MLINLAGLAGLSGLALAFARARPSTSGRALRLASAALPTVIAWASLPRSDGGGLRPVLVALLLTLWSLSRLLLVTTEPEGERPAAQPWAIGAHALRATLLTLPAQDLILNGAPFPMSVLDLAGVIFVITGGAVEHRLVRQARHARPIDAPLGWRPMTGPWAWSQEPARAASLLVVLGLWLLAAAGGVPLLGLVGLLGAGLGQWLWIARRPAEADPERQAWVQRTSALIPLPPGLALPSLSALWTGSGPAAAPPPEPPDRGYWTPAPGEAIPPVIDRSAARHAAPAAAPAPRAASPSKKDSDASPQSPPPDPYRRS